MATFTNRAVLSYSGGTANSNLVTGEIIEVLSATKKATKSTYGSDDTITYVISIKNSGSSPITSLTISDNLGAYSFNTSTLIPLDYVEGSVNYYLNGVIQPAPTVASNSPLTLEGISIPGGGNAIFIYETKTNDFAPLSAEAEITNTVTVNGAQLTAPITAEETVSATPTARLSITKALSPATVSENGQLTYTFTIQNFGNTEAVAADNIIITDTFNPILKSISVALNGTALAAQTDYTYDITTGLFSTIGGKITVPAAEYVRNEQTGAWSAIPGSATLTVTGTV